MRAGFGVDARVGEAKALDGATGEEVLLDNFSSVLRLDEAIPDRFGIDHHGGAVLALIQAQGLVDADAIGDAGRLGELLQLGVQIALSIGRA